MGQFDKKNGFTCEYCGEHLGGGDYDFYQSLQMTKDAGWVSRKDKDGEWHKFCCKEHADIWWEFEGNYTTVTVNKKDLHS